jgi:hypothetical protein
MLTIDILVPTSTYPDTWCTPGVVSHTPESDTVLKLTSVRIFDSKRLCCTAPAKEMYTAASQSQVDTFDSLPNPRSTTMVEETKKERGRRVKRLTI